MEAKPIGEVIRSLPEFQDREEASLETSSEPYILTPEEEEIAIEHAITQAKKWYAWRMNRIHASEIEIMSRIEGLGISELIDRDEVLRRANAVKHQDIWHKEQKLLRKKEEEDRQKSLRETWTAGKMYQLMRWTAQNEYGKTLIENNETFPLIKVLCLFLSRDPRFETELGYSLKKGLYIRGVSGLGKTFLAQCVADNELNPITIVNMKEVEHEVRESGNYEPRYKGILYLDDVGTEETPVIHYGTKINWFKSFIELFYMKGQFNRLIFSTNLSAAEIEERYTQRVRSRLKDMVNLIDVDGEDLRGIE